MPQNFSFLLTRSWERIYRQLIEIDLLLKSMDIQEIENIRKRTLEYIERMRIPNNFGKYKYSSSSISPVLYASTYAILTRHLYKDLLLDNNSKDQWIELLLSYQDSDGLFRDQVIQNNLADTEDWWGWRHLTVHVLMALKVLGHTTDRKIRILEKLFHKNTLLSWIHKFDWENNADFASNAIQNIGTFLQYSRDYQNWGDAGECLENLYIELLKLQDKKTGLWGRNFYTPTLRSRGVQAAYHILLLFFYDKKDIPYLERIIDNTLQTQNITGGYGAHLSSSACEDIDSIDILARSSCITNYKKNEIEHSLKKSLAWILTNQNSDGGYVFQRGCRFIYGHNEMSSGIDQSAMFPTWFRTLSLAYIAQVNNNNSSNNDDWVFIDCPGYQFWKK